MTSPKIKIPGFQFSGIHCGIKDSSRKKDLSLIFSEEPDTIVDGVFTKNKVVAAPVEICKKIIKKGKAQLIVVNSGIANACTGPKGMANALRTQKEAAKLFNLSPSSVLISSTGKIGDQLPMKPLISGLQTAKEKLNSKNFYEATQGIMTTDQYPKFASSRSKINGKDFSIAVLAKGAGMLRPDMATMLAYVLTDLKVSRATLKKIFRSAVNQTLNRITVDGDTSTNDTVIMMANGRANNKEFSATSPAGKKVEKILINLLEDMAKKIALDGEGATTCCTVFVKGAKSQADAKKIAYAIGNSPLVKTALFGNDPNWGRIMAATGYSGAFVKQDKISIQMGPYLLVKNGMGCITDAKKIAKVSQYMKQREIEMTVDIKQGQADFHIFMSDLTYDYIHLNAEYHT